jgi:hypothetical protein
MVDVWTDADFDLVYGQLIGKYGVNVADPDIKAQENNKSNLSASDHAESTQHAYKAYVSENKRGQYDGSGISLSISELPQDSAKDSVNQESIRNTKDSYSQRVPIELDGTTQCTGDNTTKAVQFDEAKFITKSKLENKKPTMRTQTTRHIHTLQGRMLCKAQQRTNRKETWARWL